MNHPYNLGVYFDAINAVSDETQTWLNRGFVWYYGFDLEMSFRCFKQAVELNPDYAMAYWGMAYTSGIYYNKPWGRMQQDELVEKLQLTYRYSSRSKTKIRLCVRQGCNANQCIASAVPITDCSRTRALRSLE